jgi:DNA (cytosine-5)-methyltransferase 1
MYCATIRLILLLADRVALIYALPGASVRETKVMIRLSEEEKGLLDVAAQMSGLMTASWARMMLLRMARQPVKAVREVDGAHAQRETGLVSLFCGAGGLDEGFRQAGFRTLVAVDTDAEAVNTFALNHQSARTAVRDVTDLTLSELDELVGFRLEPVGVLGGPPCQSFSVSNVHQSDNDERHALPESYAALLARLNKRSPISFFVFENVPGLLGKKHVHRYERFKKLFEKAGFKLYENLLDAKNFGVPQERPRILIVGINHDKHPEATWKPPEAEGGLVTVRDTIAGLPEPVVNARGLDPATFPVHPNHWCLVPKSRKFGNGGLREGEMYGRSFRALTWDKPSWTVAYGHREVHVHPEGKRRLSIYEAMQLQTFPKTYRLTGNMTAQVRLVSDAVPPRLAWHVARAIRASLGI